MGGCHTDCIEKPLNRAFEIVGKCVGSYPWWFLIIPMVLSAGLGGGFYFLAEMENQAKGIENQFTPVNGQAKDERLVVQTYFPHDELEFSRQRLYTEGTFGSLIFTSAADTADILDAKPFSEIIKINDQILEIEVDKQTFRSLCVLAGGECVLNSIFSAVYNSKGTIHYPMNNNTFLGSEIGGVELIAGTTQIESARAIRLFYFLKEDNATLNNLWLKKFISNVSDIQMKGVDVSYFTSLSREEEFESNSDSIVPLFSVTYVLAINFSIFSCMRLDCVRNKVWVAMFGVLSTGLAVLSSFGLLLCCGMPFSMTVRSAPFLILGIGVDDMFIMINGWQQTQVLESVKNRMAATYKEAAVSITITTLTNLLAFYIGLLTPFRSVQSFCMYTGTAVVFCYLYNLTFFGAFLALNGRREKSNRHWFTCLKVPKPESPDFKVKNADMCCVGGAYDLGTGTEKPMPVTIFLKNYYGPFLTNTWTKLVVILLYAGYLATSIYGCLNMKEGIELKNLASDDSYVGKYYDNEDYFTDYGPSVMVVVTDIYFKYWDPSSRYQLDSCLKTFGNLTFGNELRVDPELTVSWLRAYLQYGDAMGLNLNDKLTFIMNLTNFFNATPRTSLFRQDVNFSVAETNIYASRMFIQTINIRTPVDEKNLLNKFREIAQSDACPGSLVVYHPAFIFYDQYAVIVTNTIQNVLVATLAMLVISLSLIPSPICSLWVTFAIASIIVGVSGFMALWGTSLDSVSMINLIICIGFSVDFTAHISYAFVSSKKPTANEKATEAVEMLGYPIIQGAVSTILGVVVLSAAKSYIFRTFFKIMFLVIGFGAVHGIVFLPVFLTLIGTCCQKVSNRSRDTNTNGMPLDKNSSQVAKTATPPVQTNSNKTPKRIQPVDDPDCP